MLFSHNLCNNYITGEWQRLQSWYTDTHEYADDPIAQWVKVILDFVAFLLKKIF